VLDALPGHLPWQRVVHFHLPTTKRRVSVSFLAARKLGGFFRPTDCSLCCGLQQARRVSLATFPHIDIRGHIFHGMWKVSMNLGITLEGRTRGMNQRKLDKDGGEKKRTMSRRRFVGAAAAVLGGAGVGGLGAQTSEPASAGGVELFSQFTRLPAKSITPGGWLLRYAQINADGWVLKYAKDAMPAVWGRYVHRTSNPDLGFTDNGEWKDAPDYGAYFGDALVHYGALFPNSATGTEAEKWAAQLAGSQDSDGYIGAFTPKARWQCWLEMFHQSLLIDALMFRYDCTGDPAVLRTCERAADLIVQIWSQPSAQVKMDIFSDHGAVIVRTMGKLYAATGNDSYRKMGRAVLERYGRVKGYLAGGNVVVHDHNAVASEHIGLPAAVYEYTGVPEFLQASRAGWEMMQPYLSVDGTPHGNEMIYETGSRANCEHCGAVEWMISSRELLRTTGEAKYADAVERAMFNGYAAPKRPDGMAVGYMHTPNQLVATEWSQPHDNGGDIDYWASRQHFSTAHEPLCCNANGPRGIPFYVESMVMRSEDGVAVAHYGPCTANVTLPHGGRVVLEIDTAYPFEDEVRVKVEPEKAASFALQFRIPGWCVGAAIEVNGVQFQPAPKPGTFVKLQRQWEAGDKVKLQFQNQVRLIWRRRPEFRIRVQCAAVERGPLVFALPVEEDWQSFVGPAHGPGQDIKSWRLFPKEGSIWSYALIIDHNNPERSLSLRKLSEDAQPWGPHPPCGLEVKARRVLNWQMEGDPQHPKTPGFPFNPMKLSDEVESVTLVPFGATRLRMAFLPIISG